MPGIRAEDSDSLMETFDILSDAAAMDDIREAEALTEDQWVPGDVVAAELRAVGRMR